MCKHPFPALASLVLACKQCELLNACLPSWPGTALRHLTSAASLRSVALAAANI